MAYTTINKSTDYFNTKLYTANNSSSLAVTGVGHQPDFVWVKNRNSDAAHIIMDSVRGVTKHLVGSSNAGEVTSSAYMASFDNDGFTLNNDADVNGLSRTYASWNWKAGTAFSNNAGANGATLASTGSVNDTAGFSIVSYTGNTTAGATIKHGLSTKPDVIICKARQNSGGAIEWVVYHKGIPTPQNNTLCLNTTAAKVDRTIAWNDTAPTSSVFSVGTWVGTNATVPMIAYCFAEKTGYSKFGSYVGNGNANGTFIYTGFKPAWILTKKSSASGDSWNLHDSTRSPANPANKRLTPDTSDAEADSAQYDLLSNGFKALQTTGSTNGSGATYIYMCFGQSIVGSNNVPCTAR